MAYKKIIKVSNVCQVLDKSKYLAQDSFYGITFTNNGDGTITANGTCTAEYYTAYILENPLKDKMVIGHKYALFAGNSLATYYPAEVILMFSPKSDGGFFAASNVEHDGGKVGWILPEGSYSSYSKVELRIRSGATVENFVFKPQLFDLTEMYGAGNEPTTVEQFRQDFPDEMYDYSPHCWLTSYKRVFMTGGGNYLTAYQRNLTCKTKNLFDYSKVNNLMYVGGFSINQYFIKNGNKFTVMYPMSKGATYLDYIMPLKAGTYTLSLLAYGTVSGATNGFFGLVKVENNYKVLQYNKYAKSWLSGNDRQSYTLTIEEDGNYAVYAYSGYSNSTNLDSTFWDIQLELGDTATPYVPYGYL